MKFFKKDGKEDIPKESPVEISMENFLKEVESFPIEGKCASEGNFIGIINDKDETIQFVRFEQNSWFLDFPILKDGVYSHSLQNHDLTTNEVKKVITMFFRGEDWRALINLSSSKREPLVDKTKRRFESFKEVGNEGAVMMEEGALTKKEFMKKLEDFPYSTDNITYGIFAELSKPFVMVKNSDGNWEVRLDVENPNIDVEISENEEYLDYKKILDIKKWVNVQF